MKKIKIIHYSYVAEINKLDIKFNYQNELNHNRKRLVNYLGVLQHS